MRPLVVSLHEYLVPTLSSVPFPFAARRLGTGILQAVRLIAQREIPAFGDLCVTIGAMKIASPISSPLMR